MVVPGTDATLISTLLVSCFLEQLKPIQVPMITEDRNLLQDRSFQGSVSPLHSTLLSWQGPARASSIPPSATGHHRLGSTRPYSPPPKIQNLLQKPGRWHHTCLKPGQYLSTQPGRIRPWAALRTTRSFPPTSPGQEKKNPCVLNLVHNSSAGI